MGVTSRTEPVINYQEGQNITKKDHKVNNVTPQTNNAIKIYNKTTKEVYIDKQERVKPNSSSNHNTDELDIHVAKLKQEIQRKHREKEVSEADIMKGVEENGEINEKLKVKSSDKGKTKSKSQQSLQKAEIIKRKQQPVEETTVQKECHSISQNITNKGMKSLVTCNKITYNTSLNEQESPSQVKQQISDELIQENDYQIKIRKQKQLKTEQSQQIQIPDVDTEKKSKEVENQNKKLESKDNITYTLEKTEQNNRKDSTGENVINNRAQNFGEIIEDKVPVKLANIQTKAKQQDNDVVANKTSNN